MTTTSNANCALNVQTYIPVALSVQVAFIALHQENASLTSQQCLAKRIKWRKEEYRHAYMESAIEQGIAWQIRVNREKRQLSQLDLAKKIGSRQSAISRAENPSYGRHSLDTLIKIANAFDCALQVRLVPYSILAQDSEDLSPSALYAKSYSEENIHDKTSAEKFAIGVCGTVSATT